MLMMKVTGRQQRPTPAAIQLFFSDIFPIQRHKAPYWADQTEREKQMEKQQQTLSSRNVFFSLVP